MRPVKLDGDRAAMATATAAGRARVAVVRKRTKTSVTELLDHAYIAVVTWIGSRIADGSGGREKDAGARPPYVHGRKRIYRTWTET
jgi:hypothetical protein